MIYVEEKVFERQIELLYLLSEREKFKICAWLYPDSNTRELAGFKVCQNKSKLDPITTYIDGFEPLHTELVQATNENINAFACAKSELGANCDSLALYSQISSSWVAAIVGHEGMCLVKSEEVLPILINSGFNASKEAPAWW